MGKLRKYIRDNEGRFAETPGGGGAKPARNPTPAHKRDASLRKLADQTMARERATGRVATPNGRSMADPKPPRNPTPAHKRDASLRKLAEQTMARERDLRRRS